MQLALAPVMLALGVGLGEGLQHCFFLIDIRFTFIQILK